MNLRFGLGSLLLLAATSLIFADERDSLRFIVGLNPVPPARSSAHRTPADGKLTAQTSEIKFAGAALVRFYQLFISPQDVSACPFDPTCSEYARQAIYKYGLAAGVVMAADRLQRCNGFSARSYPRDPATGRLVDPP